MSETINPIIENYSEELRTASGNVVRQLEIVDSFIANVLTQGEDYGIIPGVNKPSLFKSGAEKFAALFEVVPQKQVTYRELDLTIPIIIPDKYKPGTDKDKNIMGLVAIEVTCILKDALGAIKGSGLGACTNLEPKMAQNAGNVYNNVIKMAGKRAYVDAILTLSLVSGRFTQDMEDADRSELTAGASRASSNDDSNSDEFVIDFGTCAGKPFSAIPDNSVQWYGKAARASIADKAKAGFKVKNTAMLKAAEAEAAKRGISF